jgi:hypothetical protein
MTEHQTVVHAKRVSGTRKGCEHPRRVFNSNLPGAPIYGGCELNYRHI